MMDLPPNATRLYEQLAATPIPSPSRTEQRMKLAFSCTVYLAIIVTTSQLYLSTSYIIGDPTLWWFNIGNVVICAAIVCMALACVVVRVQVYMQTGSYRCRGEECVLLSRKDAKLLDLLRDEHDDVEDAVYLWLFQGKYFGRTQFEVCKAFVRRDDAQLAERLFGCC